MSEDINRIAPAILHALRDHAAGAPYEHGSFVEAVLANDLREAFAHADAFNQTNLFYIVRWCWNNLPAESWGSPERVKAWRTPPREGAGSDGVAP